MNSQLFNSASHPKLAELERRILTLEADNVRLQAEVDALRTGANRPAARRPSSKAAQTV